MKNTRETSFVLLILMIAIGCSSKRDVEDPSMPEELRIVSLNGAITETICALGIGENLVGTDITSTYPEEALELTKVGHVKSLSPEGVLSLDPTLVVVKKGELNMEFLDQVKSAGVEILRINHENSLNGAKGMVQELGEYFKIERSVIDDIHSQMISNMNDVMPISDPPKVLFIYTQGSESILVAGENTSLNSAIHLAGGENAAHGFESFKPVTEESLVAANPDVILMFKSGSESLKETGGIWSVNGMELTKAYQTKSLILMDELYLSGFTPRVGKALAELNQKLVALSERSIN